MRLGRRGFEPGVEIIIIVSVVAILIFLVAGALHEQRKLVLSENESAAIASLKAINTAMEKWYSRQVTPSYSSASLPTLAHAYPSYIDAELVKGIKKGYSFILLPVSHNEYICIAIPLSQGVAGNRIFRVTESGIVEVKTDGNWDPIR